MSETIKRNETDCRVHNHLLNNSDNEIHPFELALEVVRVIREMPETRASFRPKDVVDKVKPRLELDKSNSEVHPLIDRKVYLGEGAWQMPLVYPNTHNYTRFVNPHYVHRQQFAEVVKCRCGTGITKVVHQGFVPLEKTEHSEDCKPQWRLRARANVWAMREEIIKQMYPLGSPRGAVRDRMGYDHYNLRDIAKRFSLTLTELTEEYYQRRANTSAQLRMDGFKTHEIAEFYDVSPDTIRGDINDRTPYSSEEIYKELRKQ